VPRSEENKIKALFISPHPTFSLRRRLSGALLIYSLNGSEIELEKARQM